MNIRSNFGRGLIAAVVVVLASLCAAGVEAASKKQRVSESDVRKADYIFLEGTRQQTLGNTDGYFELLTRARELNPDDSYLGMEYGYLLLRLSQGDSALVEQGYALMSDYIDRNADDFYGNVLFAAVSGQLGKTDRAVDVWGRLHYASPDRPELTVRYAEVLASTRKPENIDRALELFDTLEIADGPGIQLSTQKIQLYYTRGDTAAMLGEARKLWEKSPTVVEYNVFAGDIYSQLGQGDSALMFYDRAIELDPSSGLAYYSRANYFRAAGDSTAYDREVFRALEQEDLDVAPKLEILRDYAARLYSDHRQQSRISDMFRRLIDLHPHERDIHNLYRDYLIAIEDYAGAAEQASYSLDIDPSDERQWLALTSLYLREAEFEKSYDAAMRGLHFYPLNPNLALLAGTSLTQMERYDEALALLEKARTLTDENDAETLSDIYTTIGDTRYAAGELDSAFVDYEAAIRLNPLNLTALNNCAYYLACENRDLDRAEQMIKLVVEERPDESTSLDTYAWVLYRKGEYEQARDTIEKALENDSDPSAELYEHAGDIFYSVGAKDEAVEFWQLGLEIEPDNADLKRKIKTRKP